MRLAPGARREPRTIFCDGFAITCKLRRTGKSLANWPIALSLNLLLVVVVGGSGYFFGPFLGAIVAFLLPEWMRFAEGYYLIGYAVLVIVLMVFCPSGLLGLAERLFLPKAKEAAPAELRPQEDVR